MNTMITKMKWLHRLCETSLICWLQRCYKNQKLSPTVERVHGNITKPTVANIYSETRSTTRTSIIAYGRPETNSRTVQVSLSRVVTEFVTSTKIIFNLELNLIAPNQLKTIWCENPIYSQDGNCRLDLTGNPGITSY